MISLLKDKNIKNITRRDVINISELLLTTNLNLSLFFITISSSFVGECHLVLSLTKLGLIPLTSAPSRHICIQVPQLFSTNVTIIMTSWPTSFSFVYNIIIRTRISYYNFFIDEPFFNFLHILIITSRCCLDY